MSNNNLKALRSKKVIVFLVLVLLLFHSQVSAKDNFYSVIHEGISSKQDQEITESLIIDHLKKNNIPFRDAGQWKVKYGPSRIVTSSGYAGNQPSGGTRFRSGGAFLITRNGGPTRSISVNFGDIYKNISISCNFGNISSGNIGGDICNVPDTKYYYKVYSTDHEKVKPYVTMKLVNGKWEVFYRGYTVEDHWRDYEAIRVR